MWRMTGAEGVECWCDSVDSQCTGCCASVRYLKQLVAALATAAALFNVGAADAPAKVFGALAVDRLLHPEVRLAAHHNAVFHGRFGHRSVGEPGNERA